VRGWPRGHPLPLEPYRRLSPHTARAASKPCVSRTDPCGLHDTGLQPSHLVPTLVPVDLVPVLDRAGGCTHGQAHVHLRFPPREGSAGVLVTRDLLEVCPLSRRGDMTTPIRSIIERLWLVPAILCPAHQQPTLRCGLPPGRRNTGFTVLRSRNMDDLAPAFTPAIVGVRVPRFKSEATDCVPFGLTLISIFG